jgi:hypothetical protein
MKISKERIKFINLYPPKDRALVRLGMRKVGIQSMGKGDTRVLWARNNEKPISEIIQEI